MGAFSKSTAFWAILLASVATLHHQKVNLAIYPRAVRNWFGPLEPVTMGRAYPVATDTSMVDKVTIVVSAKDFLSQQPEQIAFLATLIPHNMRVIYTYPRPLGDERRHEEFLATMAAAQGPLTNVTMLELGPFANPFLGWQEALKQITTPYTMAMHNDVFPLDGPRHVVSELLQALEAHPECVVAAPQIYEAEQERHLVAHTVNTNLHLRRRDDGSLFLSHEVDLVKGTNRAPPDFTEGPQDDFLEDHLFMARTSAMGRIVDPQAAYTLEYMDLQMSVRAANYSVRFVPTARVEFRVWWTKFRWDDVAFFAYRRSERLARQTKEYLQHKWGVEFPNTGFANFVKFSVAREVFLEAQDISKDHFQQEAMALSWFEWVGFNKYREEADATASWKLLPDALDARSVSTGGVRAGRSLVESVPFYNNASSVTDFLEVRQAANKMETRMGFDHLSLAVAKVQLGAGATLAPALRASCGLVIAHGNGAHTCWVYIAPFTYDHSLAFALTEPLLARLKVASRAAVYIAMNYHAADLAARTAEIQRLANLPGVTVTVCGETAAECTADAFSLPATSTLQQWAGRLNSWSTVKKALRAQFPAASSDVIEPESLFAGYLPMLLTLVVLIHLSIWATATTRGLVAVTLVFGLARVSLPEPVLALIAGLFLAVHYGGMPARCRAYTAVVAVLAVVGSAAPPALGGDLALVYAMETCVLLAAALTARRGWKLLQTLRATAPLALLAKPVSYLVPRYHYSEHQFYRADGCSEAIAAKREKAFQALSQGYRAKWPESHRCSKELATSFSDLRFAASNRAFLPFARVLQANLDPCTIITATDGTDFVDVDGVRSTDISGSYGVNVFGYERFKTFLADGLSRVRDVGCVLGPLHPLVLENVRMLKAISGKEEVSMHMSGTEAVMCATRLCRFNTKRNLVVIFGGAYHGWWDGMQTAFGSEREVDDVLTLKDLDPASMAVIVARAAEIAAVVINPLQSFHPNQPPPSDLTLASNSRNAHESNGYKEWLHEMRRVCTRHGIALVFDEVYTGFRLARRGAQEYFDVDADMVCYGKTLGGGMPNGVVCGPSRLMNRSDPAHPLRVAYVVGTFAAHPLTVACMNAFLRFLETPAAQSEYASMAGKVRVFCDETNAAMAAEALPIRVSSYSSVWTLLYQQPGRYHWMLQYYLRDEGINLSWVGTGRLNFSLDFTAEDLASVRERLIRACRRMQADGWWDVQASPGPGLAVEMVKAMIFGPSA